MAEGVGTFTVVVFGSMAVVAAHRLGIADVFLVSLGFGLGLFVALYSVGEVSLPRYFNPAVSWAGFLDRRIGLAELFGSWAAQLLGGLGAALVLAGLAGREAVGVTVTTTADAGRAFAVEFLTSVLFVMVVLGATRFTDIRSDAVLAMGLSYVGVHVVALPFGGGSVNPARSFGPALIAGRWTGVWVYLLAPMVGATVAWGLFRVLNTAVLDRDG